MDKKLETIETYNRTARAMAEKFSGLGARVPDIENAFSYVEKQNPRVLEIGCGNGRDATEILKRTNDYLGIDISEGMIEVARETAPEGAFEVCDIEIFLFPKNIDIIFAFASLLHSNKDHLQQIFARAFEALSPGGIFFVSLKFSDPYSEVTKTDEFGARTYYFYPPELVKELAGDAYQVLSCETHELRDQTWVDIYFQKP